MTDEKRVPTVPVAFVAKAIGFKKGNRRQWTAPRIDDALREVMRRSPQVSDRHHPSASAVRTGDHCLFINRAKDYGSSGVMLEICTYQRGHVPESMTPDMAAREIELQKVSLIDEAGRSGELVHTFRIVALGQVLVMQMSRGHGGGARAVQTLLTNLFRRHLQDPHHPSVDLSDIGSADLRELIALKGGVKRMTAKIAAATVPTDSKYSGMLAETMGQVGRATICTISWEAADNLDEDASIEALEEAEEEALAGVTLYFKHGGSISNLARYRERRSAQVEALPDGRPAVSAVERKLVDYMDDLRRPSNDGPIASDGTLRNARLLQAGKP